MIYLIDDKTLRQQNYGWSNERFDQYKDCLTAIHTKDELDPLKEQIFASNDIILFHDSFFDNPINLHEKNVVLIKQSLIKRTKDTGTVVFFGGAIGSRTVSGMYASMPVSVLYNNLAFFIEQYLSGKMNNAIDMHTLAFGDKADFEEIAELKEKIWRLLYSMPQDSDMHISSVIASLQKQLMEKIGAVDKFERRLSVEEYKMKISKYIKSYING